MKSRIIALVAAFALPMIASAFVPPPPPIAAKAYLLLDLQSGSRLAELNAGQRIEPASLTKLMTAYVTFKAIKEGRLRLDQQLLVSERGWKTEGSRMFLDPKIPARVDELIRGMIVQSGNDACVTLAEAIAGSEDVFAQLMNREAQRLGMKGTHFTNATGLPHPMLFTTADDLATLSGAIIRDFPQFYPIYSLKEFRYNNITQPNRNLLLYRDPFVDGLKTGHTESAGFNLIASTRRDGRRLLSVVIGTSSEIVRADESAKLLGYGSGFFETRKLYAARQAVTTLPVYKGGNDKVALGFLADAFATVPRGDAAKIQVSVNVRQPLQAPIAAGQVLGSMTMTVDGKVIGTKPLQALQAVEEGNIFRRGIDAVKLMFH